MRSSVRPLLQQRCFCVQVTSTEGGPVVGKVTKQWGGIERELFTSADRFGVSCKHFGFSVCVNYNTFSLKETNDGDIQSSDILYKMLITIISMRIFILFIMKIVHEAHNRPKHSSSIQ